MVIKCLKKSFLTAINIILDFICPIDYHSRNDFNYWTRILCFRNVISTKDWTSASRHNLVNGIIKNRHKSFELEVEYKDGSKKRFIIKER